MRPQTGQPHASMISTSGTAGTGNRNAARARSCTAVHVAGASPARMRASLQGLGPGRQGCEGTDVDDVQWQVGAAVGALRTVAAGSAPDARRHREVAGKRRVHRIPQVVQT